MQYRLLRLGAGRSEVDKRQYGFLCTFFLYFSFLLFHCVRMRSADFAPSEVLIGQLTLFPPLRSGYVKTASVFLINLHVFVPL
jgi:hypothetical protein